MSAFGSNNNFVLNIVAGLLRSATEDPNITELHSLLDIAAAGSSSNDPLSNQARQQQLPQLHDFIDQVGQLTSDQQQLDSLRQQNEQLPPDQHEQNSPSVARSSSSNENDSYETAHENDSDDDPLGFYSFLDQHGLQPPNPSNRVPSRRRSSTVPVRAARGQDCDHQDQSFPPSFEVHARGDGEDTPSLPSHAPPADQPADFERVAEDNTDRHFPDGNETFKYKGNDHEIGWATVPYGGNKIKVGKTQYKSCLGIYKCPIEGCPCIARPRVSAERKKHAKPKPPKKKHLYCVQHHVEMVHKSCNCFMKVSVNEKEDCVEIEHTGTHDHTRPHKIHASSVARERLEQVVRIAPTITSDSLAVGTQLRDPFRDVDETFTNIGYLRYQRREAKKKLQSEVTPQGMAAFDKMTNGEFILKSSSIKADDDGRIGMQTPNQKEILNMNENVLSTDTIMGFVWDPSLPNVNLTVTSTHCGLLGKTVPVLMEILFGNKESHFKAYFDDLLGAMEMETITEFERDFVGMVADFALQQKNGFIKSLEEYYNITSDDYNIEEFYAFCVVHFRRSLARISNNHAVIDMRFKDDFVKRIMELTQPELLRDDFQKKADSLLTDYPKAKAWMRWHLHDQRAKCIFPALADAPFRSHIKNTNGQESLGKQIQATCEQSRPLISQLVMHCYRYATRIDAEYCARVLGRPISYGAPRYKSVYKNDGKPPEKTSELIQVTQRRPGGRPRNSLNMAPAGNAVYDCTLAIPWGFTIPGPPIIKAGNTCAMDATLQGLIFIRAFEDGLAEAFAKEEALTTTLNLIDGRKWDEGRHKWIVHNEHLNSLIPENGRRRPTQVVLEKTVSPDGSFFWNCWSGVYDNIYHVDLFKFKRRVEYGPCTCGTDCCYDDKYGPNHLPSQPKTQKFVDMWRGSKNLQKEFIDKVFHSFDTTIPCGRDAVNSPEELGLKTAHEWIDSDDESGEPLQMFEPIAQDSSGENYSCNGRRGIKMTITEHPILLCMEVQRTGGMDRLLCVRDIQKMLRIHGYRYVLVQVILTNASHFCGVSLIKSKCMLYDGMFSGTKRCKWVPDDYPFASHTICGGGYYVGQLWYRRFDSSEDVESAGKVADDTHGENESTNPLSIPSLEDTTDLPMDAFELLRNRASPKRAMKAAKLGSKGQKKRKTSARYINGISIRAVMANGPLPKCLFCHGSIARGLVHTVNRVKLPDDRYKTNQHYHLGCCGELSRKEIEKLFAVVSASNEIDQGAKEDALEKISKYK